MWHELGLGLKMDENQLEKITTTNDIFSEPKFSEMLAQWLDGRFNCSDNCYLDTFLEALKLPTVNRFRICGRVKQAVLAKLKREGEITQEQFDAARKFGKRSATYTMQGSR